MTSRDRGTLAEAVPGTAVFYDSGRDEADPEFIMTREHVEDLRARSGFPGLARGTVI